MYNFIGLHFSPYYSIYTYGTEALHQRCINFHYTCDIHTQCRSWIMIVHTCNKIYYYDPFMNQKLGDFSHYLAPPSCKWTMVVHCNDRVSTAQIDPLILTLITSTSSSLISRLPQLAGKCTLYGWRAVDLLCCPEPFVPCLKLSRLKKMMATCIYKREKFYNLHSYIQLYSIRIIKY